MILSWGRAVAVPQSLSTAIKPARFPHGHHQPGPCVSATPNLSSGPHLLEKNFFNYPSIGHSIGETKTAYFLVNCKEIDVRLFHGKEKHKCAAAVADAGCAATAMHEGTVNNKGREHGYHVTVAEQSTGLQLHG